MSNAHFYKAYLKHSLAVDWVLADLSEPAAVSEPLESSTPYIFVAPKNLKGTPVEKMMERMVIAIKQTPQTVQTLFVEKDEDWKAPFREMISTKKIMIFGKELEAGELGEWKKEGEHYLMITNNLTAIKKQPTLKKETWGHLQTFVGMKG